MIEEISGETAVLPTEEFDFDVVVMGATGIATRPGIDGLYELYGFMVDRPVWTHELPRLFAVVGPALIQQFPALADITVPDFGPIPSDEREAAVTTWVEEILAQTGLSRRLEVRAILPDAPKVKEAVREAWDDIKDKAIVVVAAEQPPS